MPADFMPEPSAKRQAPWVRRGSELFTSVHDMLVPVLDAWDWRLTMLVWRAHVGNPPQEVELSFPPEGGGTEEIVERAYLLDGEESPLAPQIHWGAYSESSFFDDQLDEDLLDEHQDTWAMEITLLLPSDFDSGAALWGSLAGPPHDAFHPDENTPFSMVAQVCSFVRVALRAVYDAGPNPTREDIYEALINLGQIDTNGMFPHTILPNKWQSADVIHKMIFTYPCSAGEEFATDQGTCIINAPDDEWRLVER